MYCASCWRWWGGRDVCCLLPIVALCKSTFVISSIAVLETFNLDSIRMLTTYLVFIIGANWGTRSEYCSRYQARAVSQYWYETHEQGGQKLFGKQSSIKSDSEDRWCRWSRPHYGRYVSRVDVFSLVLMWFLDGVLTPAQSVLGSIQGMSHNRSMTYRLSGSNTYL